MSLENEIAIYQFGQGVHSEADLLEQFSQLDEDGKTSRFADLNFLVKRLKSLDADMKQAMTDSSLTEADVSRFFPQPDRWRVVIGHVINRPEGEFEKAYTLLLYLFKIAYQRHFTLGNPADWRYWDLSSPTVVQDVLNRHQALVEEVYANPSFRSEFASITKLWHERYRLFRTKKQEPEPTPEPQTHFDFLSYDEMITESIRLVNDKQTRGIGLLRHSLEKALAVRYKIEAEEANRVIFDVINRHSRDTYNTNLFD